MKLPLLLALALLLGGLHLASKPANTGQWKEVESTNKPLKRHEHAYVKLHDKFYLIGGRRIQPVQAYDPATETWKNLGKPPIEMHHFQAVTFGGKIYVIGALTGPYPRETPIPNIYIYTPSNDSWSKGPEIPKARRRGSAGAVVHEGKIYLVCGIQDGHRSGWVNWFDAYDPKTETWTPLPDAPRARDHFQVAVADGKLVAAAGRRSGFEGSTFAAVISEVDVYDFEKQQWSTLASPQGDLPVPRAGTGSLTLGEEILVIGGESAQKLAHSAVDALDVKTGVWRSLPPLLQGRHASQPVLHDGRIYLPSGSITRGGTETDSHEVFELAK